MSIEIKVLKDTASEAVEGLAVIAAHPEVRREMAGRCVELTANHIRGLGTNKQGWPSTGFYRAVAGNVKSDQDSDGFSLTMDHPEKPGAMRQRYYGGTITMKDKLLTIPARQEFYGRKATDFTDLRFVVFASGSKALVVGSQGVGLVNFGTGRSVTPRGAGRQARGMVAFWLVESVTQAGDVNVIPTSEQYLNQCENVLASAVAQLAQGGKT